MRTIVTVLRRQFEDLPQNLEKLLGAALLVKGNAALLSEIMVKRADFVDLTSRGTIGHEFAIAPSSNGD